MNPYTACATGFILLLTLIPLSHSKVWWVRTLDFPRLQPCAMSIRRLPSIGSDHFPLLTELVLHPRPQSDQEALGEDA